MYPHPKIWRPVAALGALVAAAVLATSTVTVAAGDTLSEIAERNDVTIAELVSWNDIDDPDLFFFGSTLIVAAPHEVTPVPASGAEAHIVTAGETLSAIASRLGTTVARLVAANGLGDPDRIFVGQRLELSRPGPAIVATTSAPVRTHTVTVGDSLSAIAARYGVDTSSLARDNAITDPDRITIGMTLTIGETAPPTTTTTAPPVTPAPLPTTTTTVAPPSTPAPLPTTTTTTTTPTPTTTVAPPVTPAPQQRNGEVLLVPLFARWSGVYNVPQDLLEAIAWKESNWRPDVVGPAGHLGLTQLSPATVELIEGGLLGRDMDPLDPEDGVQLAARFLRYLLDRTENEREATAAWVQGLSSVQSDGVTTTGADYVDAVEEIRRLRR